jgi:hypothetical protein
MVQKSKYGATDGAEKEVDVKEWLGDMAKSDPARYAQSPARPLCFCRRVCACH